MKKMYFDPKMELILFGFDVLTTSDVETVTAPEDVNLFVPENSDDF